MEAVSTVPNPRSRFSWPFNSIQTSEAYMMLIVTLAFLSFALLMIFLSGNLAFAGGTSLPGEDASGKLEAAGTLLKLLDTGLFKWGARIFAGICIMSSAWALKEQRFGIAIISVVGAIIFGTAPKWVKNIFDISDEQSLFSYSAPYNPTLLETAKVKFSHALV